MKKEIIYFCIFFLLCCAVFSYVLFPQTSVILNVGDQKSISFDLSNEKNVSVTYNVEIFCMTCANDSSLAGNLIVNTFNTSVFGPGQKKTAVLNVEAVSQIDRVYYYDVLVYDNKVLVKNQSITITGDGAKQKNNSQTKVSNFNSYLVKSPVVLFLFVLLFCYFGLKLFVGTDGKKISREMFFLLLVLSAIVLTLALYHVFY